MSSKLSAPAIMPATSDPILRSALAPAEPANDGRQTPFRGHPVFVAQHATATCCRSRLAKWHHIAAGHLLTAEEQAHAVAAIMRWLDAQERQDAPPQPDAASRRGQGSLF